MKLNFFFLLIPFILSACLKTRGEVKEFEQTKVQQQQAVALQKADAENRQSEVDEELRTLNGRIEVLENRHQNSDQDKEKKQLQETIAEQNKRLVLMQEALSKLESQVVSLSTELQGARADKAQEVKPTEKKKSQFELGVEHFEAKDWKRAILSLQKFRDENPTATKQGEATLLIAESFRELGMKDESKSFYEEVISKYPKSAEAKKARTRLKALKK